MVKTAKHIDPKCAELLNQAIESCVEVICYKPDLKEYFDLNSMQF
ncbi:TPA: hypothetical protein NJ109_001999 [Vibrio parahaemolyticus]|nr:hypothetical protein [Vibrio parahaemolyticus]HCH2589878.1 hypothetical protein [Vibrio parahaemolyticus]